MWVNQKAWEQNNSREKALVYPSLEIFGNLCSPETWAPKCGLRAIVLMLRFTHFILLIWIRGIIQLNLKGCGVKRDRVNRDAASARRQNSTWTIVTVVTFSQGRSYNAKKKREISRGADKRLCYSLLLEMQFRVKEKLRRCMLVSALFLSTDQLPWGSPTLGHVLRSVPMPCGCTQQGELQPLPTLKHLLQNSGLSWTQGLHQAPFVQTSQT